MEAIQVSATIMIIVATIIAGLNIGPKIKNIGKKSTLISVLAEEMQRTRQLQLFLYNWPKKEKDMEETGDSPENIEKYKARSFESIGFKKLPQEILDAQRTQRPVTIREDQTIACEGCTSAVLRSYLDCTEKVQDMFYRQQIAGWWSVVITSVIYMLTVLFSVTIAIDNGFGTVSQIALGILIIALLYYLSRCYWNEYEVLPNELGMKRFRGYPAGDIGQGKPWLWWLLETVEKVPSTDHPIIVEFEDVPIPVIIEETDGTDGTDEPKTKERIPNINLTIRSVWRYQNVTKALARIGRGTVAEKTISDFLEGQIRSLINVYFAEVNGDLKKIMEQCGFLGEEVDRIIQDLIIGYWRIDIDPVAVEPDTPASITKARNEQAESEYGIRTAQNKAAAEVAKLRANIKYLELLKGSKDLAIDETTMKAIVVGTVLKDTIIGIGSKLNLFVADKGLIDSVVNLFGGSSKLPTGKTLEEGIKKIDPETAKKLAAMYDAVMGVK